MSTNDIFHNSQEIYSTHLTESTSNKIAPSSWLKLFKSVMFPMSEQTQATLSAIGQQVTEGTQTSSELGMDQVSWLAEIMAHDAVNTFEEENARKPPNKYCKTLRRTVADLSLKHDMVFKGIVHRLNPDDENALQTFAIVADEIFEEGQVNWGRIVAVYAFAVHLAKYLSRNTNNNENLKETQSQSELIKDKIANFVGKYVANKLGQWIVDHGGWDAFVEYFPDHDEFESKIWRVGLLTAIGLGTLATVIATR